MARDKESVLIELISSLSKKHSGGDLIRGIGDDAAVIAPPAGQLLLVSSDMLVEGTHFLRQASPLRSVGRKALAVNLSDMNAMGGRGRFFTVSLGCPAGTTAEEVQQLYEGLLEQAEEADAVLAGGDLVHSEQWVIDVTVIGYARADAVRYRSGGSPGDMVAVTGRLGAARAGLALIEAAAGARPESYLASRVGEDSPLYRDAVECLSAQREPRPPLAAGPALAESGLATSLDDISDGLLSELHAVAESSGCGLRIEAERIPVAPAASRVARLLKQDPFLWALDGGEEYELLVTLPPSAVEQARRILGGCGVPFQVIGRLTEAAAGRRLLLPGGEQDLPVPGWSHFSPSSGED